MKGFWPLFNLEREFLVSCLSVKAPVRFDSAASEQPLRFHQRDTVAELLVGAVSERSSILREAVVGLALNW